MSEPTERRDGHDDALGGAELVHRADHLRPSDPAGTQPKVDPRSLEPDTSPRLALLSAPAPPPPSAIADAAPSKPVPQAGEARHAARFQFLYGALCTFGVAAVALVVSLLTGPAKAPEQPWSAWKPSGNGVDPAQQIADYVAPQYRLENGAQIAQVTGGPPTLNGQPLTVGIIGSGKNAARLEGNSVLYQLCGGGSECSIKGGKPSFQRWLYVSREAVELALYTFRYVGGVNQVIVTIPPVPASSAAASAASTKASSGAASAAGSAAHTSTTSAKATTVHHALLFRPQDLAGELSRPLAESLSPVAPRVSQMERSADAALVKELAEPRVYDFAVSEAQQGSPVMLLEPPGIGG